MSFQFKDNSSLLLKLENITKKYPNGVQALKGINLNVFRGEFLAVIGLSGSGKSTLLRCINKIHDPSSGNIFFSGQNITNIKESQLKLVRSKIGMIFQNFNLIERKNVLHNVLLGRLSLRQALFLGGIFHPWPEEWIAEAYEALQKVGLKEKALIRADGLSGGQKQRVAIARTLLQNPELILADEPVASLDPSTSYSVMNYLKDLNQNKNITIVCNLHFLSLVRDYSTRVIALKNGELIFEGKPSEISAKWFRNIYGEDAREVEIQ